MLYARLLPRVTGTQAVWGNAWETEPLGSLYLRIPRVVYLKECSSGHLKQALLLKNSDSWTICHIPPKLEFLKSGTLNISALTGCF